MLRVRSIMCESDTNPFTSTARLELRSSTFQPTSPTGFRQTILYRYLSAGWAAGAVKAYQHGRGRVWGLGRRSGVAQHLMAWKNGSMAMIRWLSGA